MNFGVPLTEMWRGEFCEAVHCGHVAVVGAGGRTVASWGDPDCAFLPRSSSKMIQALPLVESGAADAAGLEARHLALACASHRATEMHVSTVSAWLDGLGLSDADLRCGAMRPADRAMDETLVRADETPCQIHHTCSGKHTGFLTLGRHLKAGPEYIEIDHPVQRAVRDAFDHVTGGQVLGHATDGCAAPNFATTVSGLARAMAFYANATADGDGRARAAHRLVQAMMAHPQMVAGDGSFVTEAMRHAGGQLALKSGTEGAMVAILPQKGLGIAMRVADGGDRGAEAAMAALLVALGVFDGADPVVRDWTHKVLKNGRGMVVGERRPAPGFTGPL